MTKKFLYEETSQYQFWRFNVEELAQLRQKSLERCLGQTQVQDQSRFTVNDQIEIASFYHVKLQDVCTLLKFPFRVEATAAVFYRRFYLYNCMLEFNPRQMMLTCVFLASKVENHYISIDKFCASIPRIDVDELQKLEFDLLNELRFHLDVNHPYSALHGVYLMLRRDLKDEGGNAAQRLFDKSIEFVKDSYFTDVMFLYQPSQIAVACFHLAAESLNIELDEFMALNFASIKADTVSGLCKLIKSANKVKELPKSHEIIASINTK
ncbi:hypothetical protein MP228_009732 [Amoeboaphelidium protococcarum]|nr:hypothetical protein MP228_009732 [Amoeboaphelidium protococcarum]